MSILFYTDSCIMSILVYISVQIICVSILISKSIDVWIQEKIHRCIFPSVLFPHRCSPQRIHLGVKQLEQLQAPKVDLEKLMVYTGEVPDFFLCEHLAIFIGEKSPLLLANAAKTAGKNDVFFLKYLDFLVKSLMFVASTPQFLWQQENIRNMGNECSLVKPSFYW